MGDDSDVVTVECFGGWGNIGPRHWNVDHLSRGCSDFMVLLDGDDVRNYAKDGWRIEPDKDSEEALRKMRAGLVDFHILDRRALEFYFPPSAFEAVLQPPRALPQPL